jgi:putative thiamine transport system permease protein
MVMALVALALPVLAIAAGQYRLLLIFGLTGTQAGLFLVHLTPVLAYAFILLRGPYRGFDPRYATAGRSLGVTPWRIWVKIKLPLLRAPLAAAVAVGFSVSLVQFVPAQLIAAGRYSTLPMEAVTLASGGNRSLTAAAALLLALPALLAFALAGYAGRPRWR